MPKQKHTIAQELESEIQMQTAALQDLYTTCRVSEERIAKLKKQQTNMKAPQQKISRNVAFASQLHATWMEQGPPIICIVSSCNDAVPNWFQEHYTHHVVDLKTASQWKLELLFRAKNILPLLNRSQKISRVYFHQDGDEIACNMNEWVFSTFESSDKVYCDKRFSLWDTHDNWTVTALRKKESK